MIRIVFLSIAIVVFGACEPQCPPISRTNCHIGEVHQCWSPGVRDLDCPSSGLCCFDGCRNVCVLEAFQSKETFSFQTLQFGSSNTPKKLIMKKKKVRPSFSTNECPVVSRKSTQECNGAYSTCWNPGSSDVDCPKDSICCFDGCADTCLNEPLLPSQLRRDPCFPSPCGVQAECRVSEYGTALCLCSPGFKLDRDLNCKAECERNEDCSHEQICSFQRCVKKINYCEPSPCGPGAYCTLNQSGYPICKCNKGLVAKPDSITGCGLQCIRDSECSLSQICFQNKCITKPDPCTPSPCGPGAYCESNSAGNAICRCEKELVPKPDTITGCAPECTIDDDCLNDYSCENQRCVEKKDPCVPSPCGSGSECTVNFHGNPVCRCYPGLIPKPDSITGCGPECDSDLDCKTNYICTPNKKCDRKPDPCSPNPCGKGTICNENKDGNPVCRCEEGLFPKPDTISGCGPECLTNYECRDDYICASQKCVKKPDPCLPSPCGPGAYCTINSFGDAICKCKEGLFPKPDTITGCGPECKTDSECLSEQICKNYKCMTKPNPCQEKPCGINADCQNSGPTGFKCICPPHYFGNPNEKCIKSECENDEECSLLQACHNYKCVDPCLNSECSASDFCKVVAHVPICGFNYDEPKEIPQSRFIIGSRNPLTPLPLASSRKAFVIGSRVNDKPNSSLLF